MKFVCSQTELNTHLSVVSRAVPARPSHPVLANVLLTVDEKLQQVRLTGFDLSLGVQTSFPASVESDGQLTLPAKLLTDIVSRLPDGDVVLDEEEGELIVTITSASGQYQVRGMSAEEYPDLPTIEGGNVAFLPVDSLSEGLKGTLFSSSTDETKQVLTGVHLKADVDGLEFAATDGHRLAVVQTIYEDVDSETEEELADTADASDADNRGEDTAHFDVTVPGKALRELERMLQVHQSSEAIAVRFDQGQLIIDWDNQRLTSRLLEGQYPNYRQLIPNQFSRQATIERRLLISALERIAVLADQKNGIVKISLNTVDQEVMISVDAPDVGSGKESIPAQISGEDLEIAFNVKYLLEGLKAFDAADVQLQFNTSTSPAIATPLGGFKMTYLVMPVQIRS